MVSTVQKLYVCCLKLPQYRRSRSSFQPVLAGGARAAWFGISVVFMYNECYTRRLLLNVAAVNV